MAAKFLSHINYFRAFAILNIMLIHAWQIPPQYDSAPGAGAVAAMREILFHDSTIYFLFISGFLARYLSAQFSAARYCKHKLLYVVLPYVLFSTVFFIKANLAAIIRGGASAGDLILRLPGVLLHGNAQVQYWYIPFMIPVFLATPLLLKLPKEAFKILTLIAACLPLLGTRSGTAISAGQYLFFVPAYILGMYFAIDYPAAISGLEQKKRLYFLLAAAATAALVLVGCESHHIAGINLTESLFYAQKLALCLLWLAVFRQLEDRKIPALALFAKYSFTLYFVHIQITSTRFTDLYYAWVMKMIPALLVPASVVFAALACGLALAVCMLAKKLTGRHSRYLIGA